jgi:hypothetical protein
MKLGFMFGMSDPPPSDELINAHLNTSTGYDSGQLQGLRPSSLTRPHGPHDSEHQEEGWDITACLTACKRNDDLFLGSQTPNE